jgi:hypothetical protein
MFIRIRVIMSPVKNAEILLKVMRGYQGLWEALLVLIPDGR